MKPPSYSQINTVNEIPKQKFAVTAVQLYCPSRCTYDIVVSIILWVIFFCCSLRAQFAVEGAPINMLHGSSTEEQAQKEIEYFFPMEQTVAVIKPDAYQTKGLWFQKLLYDFEVFS